MPGDIQTIARRSYELLKQNPSHPSLQFKPVRNGSYRSVRVNLGYRALGVPVPEGVQWFWIGSHADYDKLLG
ncbi:MAG: ParE family toxin-like protein [Panacagrimonas sp.]